MNEIKNKTQNVSLDALGRKLKRSYRLRLDFFRDKMRSKPSTLAAMGKLIIRFQRLEFTIQDYVWRLLGVTFEDSNIKL